MKYNLDNKVILITGASKGIGKSISIKLAQNGARVAILSRNEEELKKIHQELTDKNLKSIYLKTDVSSLNDLESAVDYTKSTWGTVDGIVNNAGIISDNLLMRMKDEEFDNVVDTNLKGTYYCTKACVPSMVKNRWGRIINITSVVGIRGNIGQSNYSASKGAIHSFTYSLAKELATRGITVNAIAPGYIKTATVDVLSEKLKDHIMTWIPMSRFGTPDEISGMAAFIASEKAKYMTGEVVRIDGGMAI